MCSDERLGTGQELWLGLEPLIYFVPNTHLLQGLRTLELLCVPPPAPQKRGGIGVGVLGKKRWGKNWRALPSSLGAPPLPLQSYLRCCGDPVGNGLPILKAREGNEGLRS